jgi:hypothetical protein
MRLYTALRFALALMVCAGFLVCFGQNAAPTHDAGVKAADVESAIGLLCPARSIVRGSAGVVEGCNTCPRGTSFEGDGTSKLQIDARTAGHFTSATADNLILSASGCEPHADNFGGSYVFAMTGGKARLVRYDDGLITDGCHKFAFADGRHFLVCQGGWAGQGEADIQLSMITFDATAKSQSAVLLSLQDTTGTCDDDSLQSVRASNIQEMRFTPPGTETITGMTVLASFGMARCGSIANIQPAKDGKPKTLGKVYELNFVFDGRHFTPTAETRVAMKHIQPE